MFFVFLGRVESDKTHTAKRSLFLQHHFVEKFSSSFVMPDWRLQGASTSFPNFIVQNFSWKAFREGENFKSSTNSCLSVFVSPVRKKAGTRSDAGNVMRLCGTNWNPKQLKMHAIDFICSERWLRMTGGAVIWNEFLKTRSTSHRKVLSFIAPGDFSAYFSDILYSCEDFAQRFLSHENFSAMEGRGFCERFDYPLFLFV